MRLSELSSKNVVSVDDGRMLGQVVDVSFDDNYQIQILYVCQQLGSIKRLLPWFFGCEEHMIAVKNIVAVGKDVILVHNC